MKKNQEPGTQIPWYSANNKNHEAKTVQPLIGVASTAVDKYMKPYISLEQHNMEDQLVQSALDKTVDTRGELSVFTSCTVLFLCIEHSITRCILRMKKLQMKVIIFM